MSLGYDGSYGRVAAFAREWKADLQRELQASGRGTFVPLTFDPGEAFQFDWSEDWAIIGNERTKLQVAHTKLSYSRAFIVRAYLLQTHEMLFDAHNLLMQKQITELADIRNNVAHGYSENFEDSDVRDMIAYVEAFVSQHLS